MASTSAPNAQQVRQILAGINKCAELWGELRVLTRSYPSMNTDVFHDVAYSFETILQDGQKSIKEFMEVPKNQAAFNQGDNQSYAALQVVTEMQKPLLQTLEDIKMQLTRAYQDQFSSSKAKRTSMNPDDILDIGRIMDMRDTAQDHVKTTSKALKELAWRIEASPQAQQQRPRSQQQPAQPSYQAPYRPAPQPEYEAVPDMPPRPAPQRPVRQPVPPPQQTAPQSPMISIPPTSDPNVKPPNPIAVASVGEYPGIYCDGALRLQRDSSLTIRDILRQTKDATTPLLCRHCNLALGDDGFRDAILQGQRKGTTLAKQHIMACASIFDRRAMFKCLACSTEELDSEFRDMEDFKAHLKCH